MKTKIILFLLFLSIKITSAQNIVILDSSTKKQIPYVAIQNLKDNIGFYANEKGKISLQEIKGDSLKLFHIGYKPLRLKVSEVKDTIFLEPNLEVLDEVVIINAKAKEKTIGYIKKEKTLSLSIKEKTELATLIRYKRNYRRAYIKKIFIPIGKMNLSLKKNNIIESFPNFSSVFRVHIYSNTNGKPSSRLLKKSLPIVCSQKSPNIIEVNVSNEYIKFPKEGVFVGIEMISSKLDKESKIVGEMRFKLPTFKFTKKKKKNITSFSFIKNIFSGNKWVHLNDYNKFIQTQNSVYNMAVSLELSVYE